MERNNELDFLRSFACFLVIVIHVSADFVVDNINNYNFQFTIGNFFDSISRISVPIFVMLSGAFILGNGHNSDYFRFYKKTFNKIVIPGIIWSIFYTIFNYFYLPKLTALRGGEFQYIILLKNWFYGIPHYHLWYIFSTLGLYIVTPVLIKLKDDIGENNFFKLSVVILLLDLVIAANSTLYWIIEFTNYLGYFTLGYTLKQYSEKYRFNPKFTGLFTFLSALTIFFITEYLVKYNLLNKTLYFYNYLSPFVALSAIFCFLTFLNIRIKHETFRNLSNNSFNIYLIHPLVLSIFQYSLLYYKLSVNALWYIPVVSIIVFIFSYFISDNVIRFTSSNFAISIYRKISFK
ncbi:MAG: acyltransferase family protein [Fusobacteriaceae bacterium]|nr:acyltransferase family protein [Fusobacteriaceae bacterium]